VSLNDSDWLQAIESANVEAPAGMDRATYAAALNKRVTDLFPTDALFARILPRDPGGLAPALNRLQPALAKNPGAFGLSFDDLKLDGMNPQEFAALRLDHERLQRLANLHPGLGLTEVLNSNLTSAEKARTINQRLDLVGSVYRMNPSAEFLT